MRQADVLLQKGHFEQQILGIERRQKLLIDKLLNGTITDTAYRAKEVDFQARLTVLRSQTHDGVLDELEVEAVLNAAEYVLQNPDRLWQRLPLEGRQRLQHVFFPEGLSLSRSEGFGTNATGRLLNALGGVVEAKSALAPHAVSSRNQLMGRLRLFVNFYPTVQQAIG